MTSSASLLRPEQSLRLLAEQGAALAATPESALGQHVARADRRVARAGEHLSGVCSDETADRPLALTAWKLLLTVWRRKPLDTAAARGKIPIARGIDDDIRI
ncbi:hypothetical protein Srot_0712 [Segniliparus rotundus DSM 44985]|uniref:Uncharacterized protein n=1 Tax=Segniliparus rotundus (strain ATCC BAA-972 / CDC 1076 / CIP 108378 / DSM 44985 / JCM 13578) TaxID=640132 RepID=D6ZDD0_SEGRD|nr:hypothetical protein [Segniliparus rotundus]ADG97194.1 hypothetical protein Srot_0712 [Segniliparus rotundus DSM 44985]